VTDGVTETTVPVVARLPPQLPVYQYQPTALLSVPVAVSVVLLPQTTGLVPADNVGVPGVAATGPAFITVARLEMPASCIPTMGKP